MREEDDFPNVARQGWYLLLRDTSGLRHAIRIQNVIGISDAGHDRAGETVVTTSLGKIVVAADLAEVLAALT